MTDDGSAYAAGYDAATEAWQEEREHLVDDYEARIARMQPVVDAAIAYFKLEDIVTNPLIPQSPTWRQEVAARHIALQNAVKAYQEAQR